MFKDMSDASAKQAQNIRSLREEIAAFRKDVSMTIKPILKCRRGH